jgi:hypothetical protein
LDPLIHSLSAQFVIVDRGQRGEAAGAVAEALMQRFEEGSSLQAQKVFCNSIGS